MPMVTSAPIRARCATSGSRSAATPTGAANVNVLFDNDLPAGGNSLKTDEGRAMLEHIYDIAPGAGLAYYNGFSQAGGETVMATGIRALATQAGAGVIVDDIGF